MKSFDGANYLIGAFIFVVGPGVLLAPLAVPLAKRFGVASPTTLFLSGWTAGALFILLLLAVSRRRTNDS